MDWLLDPRGQGGAADTSSVIAEYLRRHVGDDVDRPDVAETLREVVGSGGSDRLLWAHLDWAAVRPVLTVHRLSPAAPEVLGEAGVEGGSKVDHRRLEVLTPLVESTAEPVVLAVERRQSLERELDPSVLKAEVDPLRDGLAGLPVALVAAAEAYPAASGRQLAAVAGARLADGAVGDRPVRTADDVARLFVEAHGAMGSQPQVLSADEHMVDLAVGECPFRDAGAGDAVCGVSAAMAGRLAARVNGSSTVVLEEAIRRGDPVCRMQVWLDTPEEGVEGQTFTWPVAHDPSDQDAPRMELSVALPRESSSVPVVRRLAGQALRAFGVTDEHIDDVQLAISEACANVVDHAVDTDTYEVRIDLAADRCSITVLDQGHGFDSTQVARRPEDDAETGRGLALMRALVDNVAFEDQPQAGAVVHMVKELEYDHRHPLHVNRINPPARRGS